MSAFDRISNIENRINELEARLDSGNPASKAGGAGRPWMTSGRSPSHSGVSFESLLNTLSEEKRFKGASSSSAPGAWKGDPKDFDSMIADASKKHGVDENLVRAVIRQESAYNPKATSSCGAMGLMQLMPDTAKELGCTDGYDPYQNIMAGTKYLKQLLDQFGGNMTKTIAAYNAGPGAVTQYGGLPPYPETQDYVTKVLDNYRMYKGQGA